MNVILLIINWIHLFIYYTFNLTGEPYYEEFLNIDSNII